MCLQVSAAFTMDIQKLSFAGVSVVLSVVIVYLNDQFQKAVNGRFISAEGLHPGGVSGSLYLPSDAGGFR